MAQILTARRNPVIITARTTRQFTEVRSVNSDADQTVNSVFDKSLASDTDYKTKTANADSVLINSVIEEIKSNFTQNTSMYHVSCPL